MRRPWGDYLSQGAIILVNRSGPTVTNGSVCEKKDFHLRKCFQPSTTVVKGQLPMPFPDIGEGVFSLPWNGSETDP